MATQTADNSKPAVSTPLTPAERVAKAEAERVAVNSNQDNWEWVEIPATDLFGDVNNGVSINFTKYLPDLDEEGKPTGKPGRHFVNPEIAKEIRRLLQVKIAAEMRILQPGQDKKMQQIMARGAQLR